MTALDKGGKTISVGDKVLVPIEVPVVEVDPRGAENSEVQLVFPVLPAVSVVESGNVYKDGTAFVDIKI